MIVFYFYLCFTYVTYVTQRPNFLEVVLTS